MNKLENKTTNCKTNADTTNTARTNTKLDNHLQKYHLRGKGGGKRKNIFREGKYVLLAEGKEKEAKTNNIMKMKLSKVMGNLMLPICSLVFTIIFWALGLIHAYSCADVQDSNMSDCLTIDLA